MGASTSGGAKRPIRIGAEALRDKPSSALHNVGVGFTLPEDGAADGMVPGAAGGHWRQADVRRAIAAAEKAGLASYRIEIAPDGTISIVVGSAPDPEDSSDG